MCGQTEIDQLDVFVLSYQDVFGLNVAVGDTSPVGCAQGLGHLPSVTRHLF
jgi:hypothetical protein